MNSTDKNDGTECSVHFDEDYMYMMGSSDTTVFSYIWGLSRAGPARGYVPSKKV